MKTSSLKKTAVVVALAGMFGVSNHTQATVVSFGWTGAFTMLSPTGGPVPNSGSDYAAGYYANGGSGYGPATVHGWYGNRTPITGTLSFDTSNGAGVGAVNPFHFFGDTPGSGPYTSVVNFQEFSFQVVDTAGTIVGSLLFEWKGGHSASIVLNGSGLLASLTTMISNGPTSTISGVGALPATDGTNFGTIATPILLPLGPSPIATKTLNALGCEGQSLATQVNAYTINPTGNIANCDLTQDDGIGGSPMVSPAFSSFNINLDITSVHLDSPVCPPSLDSCSPPVPLPPAVWLFGSGLLGLIGFARRKKKVR